MNTKYVGIVVALFALLGGFFWSQNRGVLSTSSQATTTPTIVIDPTATSTIQNRYTIERVSEAPTKAPVYPPLKRPLSPQATPTQIQAVSTTITSLEKNPNLLQLWMQLAALRFALKDYEGAVSIWEFAAKQKVPGANESLGNTYANYLKDSTKAEQYYQKAIAENPTQAAYYRALAEFYVGQNKNTQAEATLRAGIKAQPQAIDLQVLLARYLRTWGNILESNATYDAAALAAEKAGSTQLAESIRAEKEQR